MAKSKTVTPSAIQELEKALPRPRNIFSARRRVTVDFTGQESRTKQHFKDECDINQIMEKYARTGVLPIPVNSRAVYGDYSTPFDFQEAQELIIRAREQFEALPSGLRNRFGNDPKNFLAFCSDPGNKKEMGELGLLKEPVGDPLERKIEGTKGAPPSEAREQTSKDT